MYKLYIEGKKVFLLDQEKKNKFVGQIDNHLGKPQYIFSNCEIDDYNSKYDDFKDLMINRIPDSILFCFSIEDKGQIIEDLKEVPYPFNFIELVKCNKYATINLSASTEGENWLIRWSREPFFNQLIIIAKEYEELKTVVNENWTYEQGRISLEFIIKEEMTINEAIKYISRITKKIISEVEVALTGLTKFQEILNVWMLNKQNASEEFWQKTLMEYSWVIGQSLSLPFIIFHDKAFIGGKDIGNQNGGIIDFIYKNKYTNNITLIEIKNPKTPLLGMKYRQVYSLSCEMSGAINQVLMYKDLCQKNYYSLAGNAKERFESLNPKCLLIIGSTESLSIEEKDTFELFRNEMISVEVITFDELFEKIRILLDFSRNDCK